MPAPTAPILAPAGYVPEHAVAFGSQDGPATPVDLANPLPVALTLATAVSTALNGSTAISASVGPFVPQLGRAIWVTLADTWTGTVQLMRSSDGGTTLLPLTAGGVPWGGFTANCNESVAEETVASTTYYLAMAIASGTVSYRIAQ
jgi:hypothetical protein